MSEDAVQLQVVPPQEAQYVDLSSADVKEMITTLSKNIVVTYLELGRLLEHVKNNDYHRDYGYANFNEWVEKSGIVDFSARQAWYLIAVVKRARELGIPDSQLENVKFSKAKEILSLEGATAEQVKDLLDHAENAPLNEVKGKIAEITGNKATYYHIKFDEVSNREVWQPAIERVRAKHGGYSQSDGAHTDLSISAVCLLMAAEFLAQPEMPEDVQEGDFEDVNSA